MFRDMFCMCRHDTVQGHASMLILNNFLFNFRIESKIYCPDVVLLVRQKPSDTNSSKVK
jgi:hypothetical protein